MRVLLINGPNMDRLGKRDPSIYGSETLVDVTARLERLAADLAVGLDHLQSNHEGELIDWLHAREDESDALIVNPAGLTEVGHPLRDAIADSGLPLAVVHVSNPASRPPPWRREDIFAPLAQVVIAGAGTGGYAVALRALHRNQNANANSAGEEDRSV